MFYGLLIMLYPVDGESNPAGAAGGSLFGGIGADLSSLVKVASDATEAIKAKAKDASAAINSTILLNDFNREQEAFIKNKGEQLAPMTTDIQPTSDKKD